MKVRRFCSVVFCSLFMFTGCGVMDHLTTNANLTQTQVQLSSNNYKVIGQVVGEATDTYILGFGGLSKSTIANNSYAEMLKNANLKDSQTIIHITTTTKVKDFIVWQEISSVTTGIVIEFVDDNTIYSNSLESQNEQTNISGYSAQLSNENINETSKPANAWSSVFDGFDFDEFEDLSDVEQQKLRKQIYNILISRCKELKNHPDLVKNNIDILTSDIATFDKIDDSWYEYGNILKRNLSKVNN